MSFSKAKIIRFNDVNGNPNLAQNKVLKKTQSSTGLRSPASSDNGSVKSVPANFKTPNLPKKQKTPSSAMKIKPSNLFNTDLEALKEKSTECESKTKYIHKLTEELDQCKQCLEDLTKEKEQLQREHQNELHILEFEMLQTLNRLQKQEEDAEIQKKDIQTQLENDFEELKKAHKFQIGQVILDYEIQMKSLKECSDETLKTKLQEVEDTWNYKLQTKQSESEAILKECQTISEYSIIQCEIEKQQIKNSLEETRQVYDALQQKHQNVKRELELLEKSGAAQQTKLEEKISNLTTILKEKEVELKKLNVEIKAYQITICNSQNTIEVLKKRLFDSDRDVEQLKEELTCCEQKLIDYESKQFQLSNELHEARSINDDLEMQYESAIKLNEDSIRQVKEDLMTKVDGYENVIKDYKRKAEEEQAVKNEIMGKVNDNLEIINLMNSLIEVIENCYPKDFEEVINSYQLREESLTTENEILTLENKATIDSMKVKNQIIKNIEEKLIELEEQNDALTDKCAYYKAKSENFEEEAKDALTTRKQYIEISGKYDALLQDFENVEIENRHNKSRVLELTDQLERLAKIEEAYEKLKKEKDILENENTSYKNKFEDQKLKKYKIAVMDKENLGSPNRSVIESPSRGSPFRGSPFRERN